MTIQIAANNFPGGRGFPGGGASQEVGLPRKEGHTANGFSGGSTAGLSGAKADAGVFRKCQEKKIFF